MKYNELPIHIESKDIRDTSKIKKTSPSTKPNIVIQKPHVSDVEGILDLINDFAAKNLMLSRGPQYLYENIRDFIIAVDMNVPVGEDENGKVLHQLVACGSMYVLWKDIAEIRSLAIHPDYQHLGLGNKIVNHLKEEAQQLGIKRLFTFTLTEDFFKTLGFTKTERRGLPPKVWGECSRCPKYFKCDEVGMVLEIGSI